MANIFEVALGLAGEGTQILCRKNLSELPFIVGNVYTIKRILHKGAGDLYAKVSDEKGGSTLLPLHLYCRDNGFDGIEFALPAALYEKAYGILPEPALGKEGHLKPPPKVVIGMYESGVDEMIKVDRGKWL